MKKYTFKNIIYIILIVAVSAITINTGYSRPVITSKIQTQEVTVYITKTGAKYHKDDCSYLRQSKIAILKKEAISNGYTACSRCKP